MDDPWKFLLIVLACLGRKACGSEIINGEKAPDGSMLYMVSLQNESDHHICGGFLISEDFVLTAAHCDAPGPIHVVLGTHNLKRVDDGNTIYIEKKCKPINSLTPGYDKDIMLLKLSRKVQLKNNVQAIPLPSSEIHLNENTQCRVAGWGLNKTHGGAVDELRVVDVAIINQQVCKEKWIGLPDNVICAGGYNTCKGFCQGDSGGPLVCNGVAVGIVSFNSEKRKCVYPGLPNVYTDISMYLPWIQRILNGADCYD